ncbi:MAG: S8 family serine peptidase [Actinomycetota bacterium]|nr:S8 family serine peptidase [Actinomycetota bacterium]
MSVAALTATLLAVALVLAPRAGASGPLSSLGSAAAYVPHEVLVGYARGPLRKVTSDFESQLRVQSRRSASAPHSVLLRLPRGMSVIAAARRLRRQPGVAFAQPNFVAHQAGSFYPDDPGRAGVPQGWQRMQWNMLPGAGVNAPGAWANLLADHRPGGRGVVVAVLDTGVAYRKWRRFRRAPDLRRTRFVAPYDFVAHNRYPLDRTGHGTFVAGVVAEATNNNIGLTGLAYGASIMPLRILDSSGLGDENTIARAIRYAVVHHAKVINLSLEFLPNQVTSGAEIPEIVSAIGFAHRHGVIVVAAAGNDQDNQIAYPARARNVISVGATTADRCVAGYSNGGPQLDLVAPGGGTDAFVGSDSDCHPDRNLPPIYQMTLTSPPHWNRFGYPGYYIGTSMSAPHVAAACALVIASRVIGRRPSPARVLARLEETAVPLGSPRPNRYFGYGLLDAGAATARGG